MLRVALNKSLRDHPTIKDLHCNTPRLSTTLRRQILRLSGHCWRAKHEMVADVILWHPSHGTRGKGRPRTTCIDQLVDYTVYTIGENGAG